MLFAYRAPAHRHLQREGVPFSDLLDGALVRRAKRMLVTPGHSVVATAYALGFASPAAFTRAFKRWTGTTPSAYRAVRAAR